jgi:hypothetical protein
MTSNVDVTFPADGVKVSKAEARAQALVISQEITALQKQAGVPSSAFSNTVTLSEVNVIVRKRIAASLSSYARAQAFSRTARM